MRHVKAAVLLRRPEATDGLVDAGEGVVDTGATWTIIPRSLAQRLELPVIGGVTVQTATGPQTLNQSYVYIELAGKRMVTPVLISDTLETILIGVITLEAMGFAVDPTSGELKESEVFLLHARHHRTLR